MQSRIMFFKGSCVLLAVFFFGLAFAELSYAQRGGSGRPDSGGASRGGGASSAPSGGGRSSFAPSPSGGSAPRYTAPPRAPQPSRNFAPPSSPPPRATPPAPVARSSGGRPTTAPSTFRTPDSRPASPSVTQALPSQQTYRAQQPSQRPSVVTSPSRTDRPVTASARSETQRPTVAPAPVRSGTQRPTTAPAPARSETQRPTPGTNPRQSGRSSTDQPIFAPREPGRGPEGRPIAERLGGAPQGRPRSEGSYLDQRQPGRPTGPPRDGTSRIPPGRSDNPSGTRINEPIYRGDPRNRPGEGLPADRRPIIAPSVRPNQPPPRQFPPSRAMVYDVQRRFNGYDRYWTNDWYRRHPGSWYPMYVPPTRWWYRPSWYDTWTWYGPGFFAGFMLGSATTPYPYYPYYYGNNIVYRGDMVYVNGVPYVSAANYYSQALVLAQSTPTVVVVEQPVVVERTVAEPIQLAEGPILEPPRPDEGMQQLVTKPIQNGESEEWLPMGTFAWLDDVTQTESNIILQLATNKVGQLRGNFVNEATGETAQIRGAVDPKSQRVAFQFDGDDQTVLECGLWNLTQDSVPLLIHFDEERTEQRTLIRLTQADETLENNEELAP